MIIKYNYQTESYNLVVTDKEETLALGMFQDKKKKQDCAVGFSMAEILKIMQNLDSIIHPKSEQK